MTSTFCLSDDRVYGNHSIRKYMDKQIDREDLEKILEAGNYAPNAGGGQRSVMVAIHNKELATYVGKLNKEKIYMLIRILGSCRLCSKMD